MKVGILFVALVLFPLKGFGSNGFSEYVNSPEKPSDAPVNKVIAPEAKPQETSHNDTAKTDVRPLSGVLAKWQVCSVDSDCAAVVADCMSWDAVNKKYLKLLAGNLKSCTDAIDPGFEPEAVCSAQKCRTTDKITHVSWEDWLDQMKGNKGQ
jgi:hypothetical protein